MSDHLPECELHGNGCKHDYYPDPPLQCANCGESCICDRLRAVEQRVLDDDVLAASYHGQKGYEVGFVKGYAAALDAAREAVAVLRDRPNGLAMKDDALAAIDALREEKA